MALLQDKQTCLSEAKLKQMLTELFFNFTEVQVKPSLLLDLFEDSQGSRHSRGISTAEFLVAVGSMAATEGIPVDTSPEGRMSRAQMEARSQLGPFEDYALELRSAVRQKVKVPLVPKVVATGSILEPLSYVNPSCVLEAPPDREETEGEKLLEAMRKKMETLNLVKDDEQLREALSAELCEKESAQLTLLREANHLPQLHQPGAAEFKAFYHHMEESIPSTCQMKSWWNGCEDTSTTPVVWWRANRFCLRRSSTPAASRRRV
ncbi:unnamed protein product [Effrenium voratum]|nr:unnamed protein product [Effrenium voratum]